MIPIADLGAIVRGHKRARPDVGSGCRCTSCPSPEGWSRLDGTGVSICVQGTYWGSERQKNREETRLNSRYASPGDAGSGNPTTTSLSTQAESSLLIATKTFEPLLNASWCAPDCSGPNKFVKWNRTDFSQFAAWKSLWLIDSLAYSYYVVHWLVWSSSPELDGSYDDRMSMFTSPAKP
jgi:hypothetical protein